MSFGAEQFLNIVNTGSSSGAGSSTTTVPGLGSGKFAGGGGGGGGGGQNTQAGGGAAESITSVGGSSPEGRLLGFIQGAALLPANVIKGYEGIKSLRAQRGLTKANTRLAKENARLVREGWRAKKVRRFLLADLFDAGRKNKNGQGFFF